MAYTIVSSMEFGIVVYTLSVLAFFALLYVSVRDHASNQVGADAWGTSRDHASNQVGADAWGTSRSLEWLTHSPVPFYNFAVLRTSMRVTKWPGGVTTASTMSSPITMKISICPIIPVWPLPSAA